ncbi:MAG: hypothetical protein LBB72_06895 [Spirochaetaceae bacterium]|jgi:hypothetical protein|nr:hypothetical protein [Spirochaetaceae bacterium]
MASFDAMFPDRSDCYFALFQDAVYEHDKGINYSFDAGQFKRRDRVALVNQIAAMADLLYEILAAEDSAFTRCRPLIDYPALLGVFTRYSRDIYGFRRICAKIRKLGTALDQNQQEQLEQIISEGADFGFKVPSGNPYVERQAAVLLYWFSVLKPFHLGFRDGQNSPPESYIQSYFNEYFAYFLICLALHTQTVNLSIHEDKETFKEFLNQLHFRNLSRSSLEFFLPNNKDRV